MPCHDVFISPGTTTGTHSAAAPHNQAGRKHDLFLGTSHSLRWNRFLRNTKSSSKIIAKFFGRARIWVSKSGSFLEGAQEGKWKEQRKKKEIVLSISATPLLPPHSLAGTYSKGRFFSPQPSSANRHGQAEASSIPVWQPHPKTPIFGSETTKIWHRLLSPALV